MTTTRVQEVEAESHHIESVHSLRQNARADAYERLARTLAAEVDELRGKLDDVRMGIGCARGQRTTQYCAEVVQRDEVITKLLELVRPGEKPKYPDARMAVWKTLGGIHARACEIAGRTE